MLFLPRKLAWVFKSKEEKYEKRGLICSHLNTLCLFYEKSIKCSICEKKFSSLTLILKSIGFGFGIGLRPIVSQAYCSVQAYCEKCSFGHSLLGPNGSRVTENGRGSTFATVVEMKSNSFKFACKINEGPKKIQF